MSRPATSRLKCNPPFGRMPVLQFLVPSELVIDATYQRSLESSTSQSLIRKIAQFWNWDLCQPLVVARRSDGGLYVIDGQHRLEAARLRGDITQLPCVVVEYANTADEAASFVHLNQQRRPLTKIDLFKAAVASEDPEACAILAAMEKAGLSVAPHQNYISWKPGMLANIGGIENAWRQHGAAATQKALHVISQAFAGQILRYAGTIFPGAAAVCADEVGKRDNAARIDNLADMVGKRTQEEWRGDVMRAKADDPNLKFARASAKVIREAWAQRFGYTDLPPHTLSDTWGLSRAFKPDGEGKTWCEQCDRRKDADQARVCNDGFCPLRLSVPA